MGACDNFDDFHKNYSWNMDKNVLNLTNCEEFSITILIFIVDFTTGLLKLGELKNGHFKTSDMMFK